MAQTNKAATAPAAEAAATPRDTLKTKLIDISMASRRFSADQAWMKEAIISALDKKLSEQLEGLQDDQVDLVLKVLAFGK